MKKFLLASIFLALLPAPVQAAQVTVESIIGSWGTTIGGANVVTTNGNDFSTVTWGIGGTSGYKFEGAAVPTAPFNVGSGEFSLGTFTHTNQAINAGTAITGTTLTLAIEFSSDLFVGTKTANSVFAFIHDETSNTGDGCCDDEVKAGLVTLGTSTFDIGGVDYAFGITGFQYNGGNFASFFSPEGGSNNAILLASFKDVTEFQTAVPETSTWIMMIAGFAGVGFMAYRRSRKDQGLALAAA